ncbi:MAG: ATP-binding protein [Candidatus Sericytochromatia bacterium]
MTNSTLKDNINIEFINFQKLFGSKPNNTSYFKMRFRNIIDDLIENDINSEYRFKVFLDNNKITQKNIKDEMSIQKEEVIDFNEIKPLYNLEQVILSKEIKDEIEKSLLLVEKKNLIFEKWNLKSIVPNPKIALNFHGASGTGKTMTAHAIANKLNKNIICMDYSQIESKYIGDSAKNINLLFKQAEKTNSVLFFDEADSLLSSRIKNISQSSDQHINSLRSQLLVSIENFSGIVIFATNLAENYDKAFETRIKSIEFLPPDFEARCKIWLKHIPLELPISDDVNIEELANRYPDIYGREIREVVLDSIVSGLKDNRALFYMNDFILSCERVIKSRLVKNDEK